MVQLVRNARQASSGASAPQPGRAAQAARCQIGRTGSGGGFSQLQGAHASAGAAGAGAQACAACGADGDGDDAGGGAGSWAQEAASSAAARMPPTRVRRSGPVFDDGMWIIYLEMVLVLALGGLIVWWTLPRKKRPPADKDERPRKGD